MMSLMAATRERFGVDEFRSIMASFPTGVTVVTVLDADGTPRGLTTNATCSVSIDPPMLLVCVAKTSNTLDALLAGECFVVNFLREDRERLAQRFASKAADKFGGLSWTLATNLQPVLSQDVCAYAEARTLQRVEAGDHWVLLAAVDGGWAEPRLGPLAYHRGAYRQLKSDTVSSSVAQSLKDEAFARPSRSTPATTGRMTR